MESPGLGPGVALEWELLSEIDTTIYKKIVAEVFI